MKLKILIDMKETIKEGIITSHCGLTIGNNFTKYEIKQFIHFIHFNLKINWFGFNIFFFF
jgi:hypothetical protein